MKDPERNQTTASKRNSFSVLEQKRNALLVLKDASKLISPAWDLRDYVAVNPLFGMRDQSFFDCVNFLSKNTGADLFPSKEFLLDKVASGELTDYDLEVASKIASSELQQIHQKSMSLDILKNALAGLKDENEQDSLCLSHVYDQQNDGDVSHLISLEVSKYCAAFFDEGQAIWKKPKRTLKLFTWWRSLVRYDSQSDSISPELHDFVQSLPSSADEAIQVMTEYLLEKEEMSDTVLRGYFYQLIFSCLGWASFIKKLEFESEKSGEGFDSENKTSLVDLIAMRMAYDLCLRDEVKDYRKEITSYEKNRQYLDAEVKYIWLNALETSYRRQLEQRVGEREQLEKSGRPQAQMAFCIDVRSEIIRRHLETVSEDFQTIGFAGFFGLPLKLKKAGHHGGNHNCPVLINSQVTIEETSLPQIVKKKQEAASQLFSLKKIKSGGLSSFSFVETFGFKYFWDLLVSGFGIRRPNIDVHNIGLKKKEIEDLDWDLSPLNLETKLRLAKGSLENMGLTSDFAPFVFFFGHGSQSANNPYASALECGACAGHNGKDNADILVKILNDFEVRTKLKEEGLRIPDDTVFISGQHNTTLDKLSFRTPCQLNQRRKEELQELRLLMTKAEKKTAMERSIHLSGLKGENLFRELEDRSKDWSEIRPEWGLARNASFIVGRRSLTRKVNLEGRSFLHDYYFENDPELKKLELIMTAPMIVTNWINMQYYASTVEPRRFGAGNKAISNVVGTIGCVEGNHSDLKIGLTEQSVLYRGKYFHEPLRLQVYIEAGPEAIEEIIDKHQMVSDLIKNQWIKITSIDPKTEVFRLFVDGKWMIVKEHLCN